MRLLGSYFPCCFVYTIIVVFIDGFLALVINIPDSAIQAQTKTVLTFYTEKITWHKARGVCEELTNGQLVSILDTNTFDQIQAFERGIWKSDWDHAWVGLHWEGGVNLKWADHDCNPSTNPVGHYKDVAEMTHESDKSCYILDGGSVLLEKKSCEEENGFICQHFVTAPPSPTAAPFRLISVDPLSYAPTIPSPTCSGVCDAVIGCFMYHVIESDLCVMGVVDEGATTFVKDNPQIEGQVEKNSPTIPSGVGSGENPGPCSTFSLTSSGASLNVSDLITIGDSPCTTAPPDPTTKSPTESTVTTQESTTLSTTTTATTTATTTTTTTTPPTTTLTTETTPVTTPPSTSALTSSSSPSSSSSSLSSSSSPATSSTTLTTSTTSPSSPKSNSDFTTTMPKIGNNSQSEIEALIKELEINPRLTHKFISRLSSAKDNRQVSQMIGGSGVAVLVSVVLVIVIMDIPTFISNGRILYSYLFER